MVSGDGPDYQQEPFNLATMGYRQPGSSFKVFTLAAALSEGLITPYTEFDSHQLTINFVKQDGNAFYAPNGTGRFPVHNFGNVYSGEIPMTVATATSDNSVFAQLGTEQGMGTGHRRQVREADGHPLADLTQPVDDPRRPQHRRLRARHGPRLFDGRQRRREDLRTPRLGDIDGGPIGIDSITNCGPCESKNGDPQHTITNWGTMRTDRVLSPDVDATLTELLHGPVDDSYGTGTAAAVPGVDIAGKTGTTSNYVDAWFVGYTPQMTVAVWVGYPNSGKPMTDLYYGKPVEGGTFPAVIFHNYVTGALQILQDEASNRKAAADTVTTLTPTYTGPTSSTGTGIGTGTNSTQTTATNGTTAPANTPATQQKPDAGGTSATQNSTAGGSSNQAETLPQTTSPPPLLVVGRVHRRDHRRDHRRLRALENSQSGFLTGTDR